MDMELTSQEIKEFEQIKAAMPRYSEVVMVLANGNSTVYMKANGEILYDFGEGNVKRIYFEEDPRREQMVNAIGKLITALG
jgi:hypothetical protein